MTRQWRSINARKNVDAHDLQAVLVDDVGQRNTPQRENVILPAELSRTGEISDEVTLEMHKVKLKREITSQPTLRFENVCSWNDLKAQSADNIIEVRSRSDIREPWQVICRNERASQDGVCWIGKILLIQNERDVMVAKALGAARSVRNIADRRKP
jgi:hypothetical protein